MGGKGTFASGHRGGTLIPWESSTASGTVERVSGALPPLHGCVKRIHGTAGTTEFPNLPGLPFDVRGLELHYRAPFGMLVDKLEPQNGGYHGRATLLGREFGQFDIEEDRRWTRLSRSS